MLSYREFVYVGDPIPEITSTNYSSFLMLIQESILDSLKDRNLLTHSQYERCLNELKEINKREQKKYRA